MADNNVQRLVGIDFGTSTSLIRVKRYQGSQPIGDSHHTGSVTYGNGAGDSKAVTLVRLNGDRTFTCGRYGEEETPGSTIYREFKMDLESTDPEKQNLAKELTGEFFKYLYARYEHQQSDLGQSGDQVRTIISYPAKWKPETIAFMEEVAADAGFPSISSMDEPSAALYAVLCRKMDDITRQGLLTSGQSGYVLLIDMGAGTTDLAVCGYSISDSQDELIAADRIQTHIVSTWPNDSSALTFGGREVDRILEDYLIRYLCSCGYTAAMAENVIRGKPNVKTWKEDTVSVLLSQNQPVNTCTLARQYAVIFGQNTPFPAFGREQFQQMLGQKLEDFKQLVLGCLNDAVAAEPAFGEKGIDLVVLTGGHSSWYFTSELLDGTMPGITHPALDKVQREKNRVLRLSNPQETVALGMVYSQLPFQVAVPQPEPQVEPAPADHNTCHDSPPVSPRPACDRVALHTFICNSSFRTNQTVAGDRLPLLRANLQVPGHAVAYMGYDSTFFSTAKNGTLFTDLGIYARSTWGNPVFCSWEDFSAGFLRISPGAVYLHNDRTHSEILVGAFANVGEDVLDFYRQLQLQVQESNTPQKTDAASAPDAPADYTSVDFEAVLRQTLQQCNPAMLASLTAKSAASLMRVHLNVPYHETVYFAHDDTWFKTGRNGTVMTGSGIYSRSVGSAPCFTPWPQFAAGSIIADSGNIYLRLPDEPVKREIGYFAFSPAAAVELYLELQKAFRAAAIPASQVPQREAGTTVKTPVEEFLSLYDWSGLKEAFSPASLPVVRLEAEPSVGRLLLVHRDFDESDPTRAWFWFALGEKGICNHFKQFLPWHEFINAPIFFDRRSGDASILSKTDSRFFHAAGSPCCKLGGTFIPCKGWEMPLRLCLFFQELQKYLQDPDSYTLPHHSWSDDKAATLQAFAAQSINPGIFTLCPGVSDSQLSAYLSLSASSAPLYQFQAGNLSTQYANVCCIDQYGLHSRRSRNKPVSCTPFPVFLDNPLWVVGRDNWWSFYAGTHFLFGAGGSSEWMEITYDFLKALQQHLRDSD